MTFPDTPINIAVRQVTVHHADILSQVGTSLVALLIKVAESPLSEHYL